MPQGQDVASHRRTATASGPGLFGDLILFLLLLLVFLSPFSSLRWVGSLAIARRIGPASNVELCKGPFMRMGRILEASTLHLRWFADVWSLNRGLKLGVPA